VKLIVAIVHAEDARKLLDALMAEGFHATRINSSGGFLARSNATLLIGVEDEQVPDVFGVLRRHCHPRREFVAPVSPLSDAAEARGWKRAVQVQLGGTTAFVLDIVATLQL
jgi:uncharacterized protein YaaQ